MSTPIPIFDPEDPKLTAYALGELADPAERAEVERLLQHSLAAQLAMKDIQELTKSLSEEYDQERRSAVADPDAPVPSNVVDLASHAAPRRGSWTRPLLAIAAMLLLGAFLWPVFTAKMANSKKTAAQSRVHQAAVVQSSAAPTPPAVVPPMEIAKLDAAAHARLKLPENLGLNDSKESEPLNVNSSPAILAKSKPVDSVTAAGEAASQSSTPAVAFALRPPAAPLKELSPSTVRRTVVPNVSATALPPLPLVQSAGTLAIPPTTMGGMTGKATGMGGGGGRPVAAAQSKPEFDGFINYGSPIQLPGGNLAQVDTRNGANEGRSVAAAEVTAALPAPAARVSKNETYFYRTESGLKSKRAVDDLARNTETRARFLAETASESEPPPEAAKPEFLGKDKVIRREIPQQEFNTAAYDHLVENAFLAAKENPLSTFSIDVDTASYANVRRFLDNGSLPPPDAVRLEELINYFPYEYAPPAADSDKPFAVHLEAAACPWMPEHRLVRIGIKAKEIAVDKRPASNLVFLLDVSGSMQPPERLPLIKRAMQMLTEHLTENDHVAIVTYAGHSGLVLPSTSGDHKDTILAALDHLEAGGSTNGASGITLAYEVAKKAFIKGGTNRVILATDGDFNVGVTSQGDLVRLIQDEAQSGVFLSALGVGTDNYKDSTMQKLADKGNGNYNYLDRLEEARKVLVEQMSGTLLTVAKDVKIQVEFNPALVGLYRLIGYEKRALKKEDFNNDKIDAGEIGAGHSITALYEVVPVGQPTPGEAPAVDTLKYAAQAAKPAPEPEAAVATRDGGPREMLTVKLRHKAPDADKSERTYEVPLTDGGAADDFAKASPDFKFAAAVAAFGLSLRDSPYKGGATLGAAVEMAQEGKGADPKGYRTEFIALARRAQALKDGR